MATGARFAGVPRVWRSRGCPRPAPRHSWIGGPRAAVPVAVVLHRVCDGPNPGAFRPLPQLSLDGGLAPRATVSGKTTFHAMDHGRLHCAGAAVWCGNARTTHDIFERAGAVERRGSQKYR